MNTKSGDINSFKVPGSIRTFAHSINILRQISGYYDDASGSHGYFRDSQGSFTTFDLPGGVDTFAYGLNDLGQITGSYNDPDDNSFGFITDLKGHQTIFQVPGSVGTEPSGIDNTGDVVGEYLTFDPTIGYRFHGFLRDPLGSFLTVDVPGARNTYPSDINTSGDIAGTFDVLVGTTRVRHGYIITSGQEPLIDRLITFDVPGSIMTSAFGIDDVGNVFGAYRTPDEITHGFIRSRSGAFSFIDVPGATLAVAKGGVSTPEPASWATIILGLALVGGAMRSQRTAATRHG